MEGSHVGEAVSVLPIQPDLSLDFLPCCRQGHLLSLLIALGHYLSF